ncbi:MAG: zinc-binding dehydrogenase [Negativicutes bacterium]
MKAIAKTKREYGWLEMIDIPKPVPGPNEVLIKINAVGVCGSDVHIYKYDDTYHHIPIPLIVGHEYVGAIEETGQGVTAWKPGDKVMGESVIPCEMCSFCRTGSWQICPNRKGLGITYSGMMAEYVTVPQQILHHIPAELGDTLAVVAQPFSVALHGIERAQIPSGEKAIAVFGPGIIGLGAALSIKESNAGTVILFGITEDEAVRMPLARKLGIEAVDLGKESPRDALNRVAGPSDGFDFAIDCSGAAPALQHAFKALRKGGTLLEIGIPTGAITVDLAAMVRSETNLKTSYSASWQSYEHAIRLIGRHREQLQSMVEIYQVENYLAAFEASVRREDLKSVVIF